MILACQKKLGKKTYFTILKIFCFGTSSEKKRYFVEKIPILGGWGGGLPTWELFPHNTVFFSEDVPYSGLFADDGQGFKIRKMMCIVLQKNLGGPNESGRTKGGPK